MKLWKPIAAGIVLGIAVGAWLRGPAPDATTPVPLPPEPTQASGGAEPRQASPLAAQEDSHPVPALVADKDSGAGPLVRFLKSAGLDHLESALEAYERQALPHPRTVPLLDPASEAELLRHLRAPVSVTNKVMVIHLLGCGGGPAGVKALTQMLTNDYGDMLLTYAEDFTLKWSLNALSLLARRHDEAAALMRQACTPDFWRAARLWKVESRPVDDHIWLAVGAAIKAFQWSERPEAGEVIEFYRAHPAAMAGGRVAAGALPDADYNRAVIALHGFDRAWELRSRGLESGRSLYAEAPDWYRSEARGWMEWEAQVAAETAKRRGQSKTGL